MNTDLLNNMERHFEYRRAVTQGRIFKYASESGYDLEVFATKYMQSDFCNQEMDSDYSMFHNELDVPCMDVILAEFAKKGILIPFDKEHHYGFCSYYTGFVYRYLQLLSHISSKELIDRIPFKKMIYDYCPEDFEYEDIIKYICSKENIII